MKETFEEISSGGVLIRNNNGIKEALLIKVHYHGYELPKGHLEDGETQAQAAARELCEETSLISLPQVKNTLGDLEYTFKFNQKNIHKRVYYFLFTTNEQPQFGKIPKGVKELRWINLEELDSLPLVNEGLRKIIKNAFDSN